MRRPALLALLLCAGCGGNMVEQAKQDSYSRSELFADGKTMQAPPDGAVDRDAARREAEAERPALTAALVARGRERYGIYCTACHGADGRGEGVVVARGFPAPPSFLAPDADRSSARVYAVISDGQGRMYGFGDRVVPRDRWAIAAYIQALALAQQGSADGR